MRKPPAHARWKIEKAEPFAFRKISKIKKRMKIKNRHENFIASNSSEKSVKNLEIIQLVNNSKTPMFRVHKWWRKSDENRTSSKSPNLEMIQLVNNSKTLMFRAHKWWGIDDEKNPPPVGTFWD